MNPKLPVVSGAKTVRVLTKIGYDVDHQTGSHIILRHRKSPHRRISVPNHKELKKGTLRNILRSADLTIEDFLALL